MKTEIPETVTISIENYEAMKHELKTLREQVKEKTIVKEVMSDLVPLILIVVFMTVFFVGLLSLQLC